MVDAHPLYQALPPCTQGVVSTPAVSSRCMSAPCMQSRPEHVLSVCMDRSWKQGFLHMAIVCARLRP